MGISMGTFAKSAHFQVPENGTIFMNFEHFELVLPCFYIEKNEYHNGPSVLISLAQMVKHLYICD